MSATAQTLGDRFAALLRNAASDDEWQVMRETNRPGDQCCASHDFCDANMVMLEAFEAVLGREPVFLEGTDEAGNHSPQGEADRLLWNAAWSYAKATHLTAPAVPS